MANPVSVTFTRSLDSKSDKTVTVERGANILKTAQAVGTKITATCGERGRCRSCRIRLVKGKFSPPSLQDRVQLGAEGVREGFRLGCQTQILDDCQIEIAPAKEESSHQIFHNEDGQPYAGTVPDSGIEKHFVKAEAPEDEHEMSSDIEEILSVLPGDTDKHLSVEVLRKVPDALREASGSLTVTTFNNMIIDLESGDTTAHRYGMAFDIGTTSVVGSLLDLATGEKLASFGGLNPQATYGGDLMSRIAFAQFDDKKLQLLRGTILKAINDYIKEACTQANINANHLYKIIIVGNTCMHHIFLGIDTSNVGLAPYAPVSRRGIVLTSSDVPLKSAPNAQVCLLPIIAGFVGADTVSTIVASRLHESTETRVLVDIGTNGEVVMGNREKLMCCSAPAGPALEGGEIKHGMRGAAGAIEAVTIGGDVNCRVIGDVPPMGICGSGLIDAVAQMLEAGVLEKDGRLARKTFDSLPLYLKDRFTQDGKIRAFILADKTVSAHGEDISLTQLDIRALQLAKGAIFAGVRMLQKVMDVPDDKLEEVQLCGGFGNFINLDSAIRIRLLPDLPGARINYIGNAALIGAEMALLSETERQEAEKIAVSIEHVALATHLDFQYIFVDACRFEGE
jgi:uncharacterized 2Fe-2S/4Fe-4S cluster protein (DUF4445 family)